MKKSILYISIAIFLIISSLLIIKQRTDDVKIDIFYVDSFPKEEITTIKFCAIDKYENFDLIEVVVPNDVNIYQYVFDLYNFRRNALPLDYNVYSIHLLELESITKDNKSIYLKIKDNEIPPDEFHWVMYCLKVTYRYLGIEEVCIEFNNNIYMY